MSLAIVVAGLLLLASAAGFIVWLLRSWVKDMGAAEERERQTYRKVEGGKKANEAKDEVNKLSDSAVADWLREWHRR